MNPRLIEVLVCPICKSSLRHDKQAKELICEPDELAFPIRDDIPVMLVDEARKITRTA